LKNRASGVAQGVGPEFKPQCPKKKKEKKRGGLLSMVKFKLLSENQNFEKLVVFLTTSNT
jgi:hypothetical protein